MENGPKREAEVLSEMNRIENAIIGLNEHVSELSNRLSSVKRAEPSCEASGKDETALNCEMAQSLRGFCNRILQITDTVKIQFELLEI